MLTLEEKTVLDVMASQSQRAWPSGELKNVVLARLPQLGEKTVRRLFVKLQDAGLIQRDGEGRNTQWTLLARGPRDSMRPPVDLSLALLKLRQLARHHVPPGVIGDFQEYLEGANRVLGMSPSDSRIRSAQAWIGKTARVEPGYPMLAPEVDDAVFDAVCAALYRDESLAIAYRAADVPEGGLRDYLVLPYAIVEKAPFWYLVVSLRRSSGAQGAPFLLRMDRISTVQSRGFIMQRDAGFDLATFIRGEKIFEWFPEPPEPVVLRVTEPNGVRSPFRAARLADDQRIIEEPGGFVLSATLTPSLALRNLLLGHAATVELLAPEHLRARIAAELSVAARRYEGPAVMPALAAE
ncbi:hypothetical protein MNJPNG_25570 [Cupriavidus oxalaticus]|uniref:WYL domain-containing protein n=1 Tax=Cupriavidus oxalaticus TaxID=96344 RepID=UPI003F73D8D1